VSEQNSTTMKATKARDVRNAPAEELKARIAQHEETLVKLRFQRAIGELTNTAQFRTVRRGIAVLKTVLREQERAAK
jgi:large subunit ribosomal protein L29